MHLLLTAYDEVEGVVPLENENTDLFETIKEKLNNL